MARFMHDDSRSVGRDAFEYRVIVHFERRMPRIQLELGLGLGLPAVSLGGLHLIRYE